MITEYNLSINLLFDNKADRDKWMGKIKIAIQNAKAMLPVPKSIVARKGESIIEDTTSENW